MVKYYRIGYKNSGKIFKFIQNEDQANELIEIYFCHLKLPFLIILIVGARLRLTKNNLPNFKSPSHQKYV